MTHLAMLWLVFTGGVIVGLVLCAFFRAADIGDRQ
jgi:hypothetical protein